jgi:hypothetical protein
VEKQGAQRGKAASRTRKPDRKIEDRKMMRDPIFLSSIFLSFCLHAAPLPQISSRPARNLDHFQVQTGQHDPHEDDEDQDD